MDDYEKVDFEGLKLKIQSVHVPEGGFLLIALPREADIFEVRELVNTFTNVFSKLEPLSFPVLVWRDFNIKWMKRQELEEMKWRIEELLKEKR